MRPTSGRDEWLFGYREETVETFITVTLLYINEEIQDLPTPNAPILSSSGFPSAVEVFVSGTSSNSKMSQHTNLLQPIPIFLPKHHPVILEYPLIRHRLL